MDIPKQITFRPSEIDRVSFQLLSKHLNNDSTSSIIKFALGEALKNINDKQYDNLKTAPIGAKHFAPPLPEVNMETEEIQELVLFPDWIFVKKGRDYDTGEDYIVVRQVDPPKKEKGIKEGDPMWDYFDTNFK